VSPINAEIHDLILVDSPKFHFVFDFGVNIEVYHLTIRGADLGSYDGIDAVGYNYWIHDNEVINAFPLRERVAEELRLLIEMNVFL
jgi:rhamnogalacturonan hydrolase